MVGQLIKSHLMLTKLHTFGVMFIHTYYAVKLGFILNVITIINIDHQIEE